MCPVWTSWQENFYVCQTTSGWEVKKRAMKASIISAWSSPRLSQEVVKIHVSTSDTLLLTHTHPHTRAGICTQTHTLAFAHTRLHTKWSCSEVHSYTQNMKYTEMHTNITSSTPSSLSFRTAALSRGHSMYSSWALLLCVCGCVGLQLLYPPKVLQSHTRYIYFREHAWLSNL